MLKFQKMLQMLPQEQKIKYRRLQRYDINSQQTKNEGRPKHRDINEDNLKNESNINSNSKK